MAKRKIEGEGAAGALSKLDQATNTFDAAIISPIFNPQLVSDSLINIQTQALTGGLPPAEAFRKLERHASRASRRAAELNDGESESKFRDMATSFEAAIAMLSPKPQEAPQASQLVTSYAKG